jgi:cytoskeletal protein RodZ
MGILDIKLNNINHNPDQQYSYYLNISLLISIGVLLSRVVFSSVNTIENTTKTIDSKAGDSLMQSLSEQIQNEKRSSSNNNLLANPSRSTTSTSTITTTTATAAATTTNSLSSPSDENVYVSDRKAIALQCSSQ